MKFIDEAKIDVIAGKGGDGAATFRREKFVPRGGPSGGDGGHGGSIYAIADRNVNTLIDYRYTRRFEAQKGETGGSADCYGKGGDDISLRVPVGTQITDEETGELIADLAEHEQKILIARGGKGGLGNLHFKTSVNRAPKQKTPGEPGQVRRLRLELKVLADVGLLGLPNAGKSTCITRVSNARPRIADYPFTTLQPHLGVVDVNVEHPFVMADIPGLIEGAAEGAGLGHQFLRHLVRTRLLLHVIDVAPIDPDADPVRDAHALAKELRKYDAELADKPRWIVFNKIDVLTEEEREERLNELTKALSPDQKPFYISAVTGEGCSDLVHAIGHYLADIRAAERRAEVAKSIYNGMPDLDAPEGTEE